MGIVDTFSSPDEVVQLLLLLWCRNPNEMESGSLTENNGIDVKTTDSGYMSPPEAHLDTDLHENHPLDTVTGELSELRIGQKSPVREGELETYNSFNFWRVPLPQIGDEGGSDGARKKDKTGDPNNTSENPTTDSPNHTTEDQTRGNPNGASGELTTGHPVDESKPSEDPTPGEESKPSGDPTTGHPDEESKTPRLEFQDLGISDMDIDDCEEMEKNEKDLACDETVEDSPKRMPPLSGVPSLRFDEDYLQPYSPNMCFDDEDNRVPSPPRSPLYEQVCASLLFLNSSM